MRPKCNIEGCNNLAMTRGYTKITGEKSYRGTCDTHHKKKYGIPIPKHHFKPQRNLKKIFDQKKCQICGNESKLVADHNHLTGYIRGALCQYCNTGLGMFKDNIELLKKAIAYLRKNNNGTKYGQYKK